MLPYFCLNTTLPQADAMPCHFSCSMCPCFEASGRPPTFLDLDLRHNIRSRSSEPLVLLYAWKGNRLHAAAELAGRPRLRTLQGKMPALSQALCMLHEPAHSKKQDTQAATIRVDKPTPFIEMCRRAVDGLELVQVSRRSHFDCTDKVCAGGPLGDQAT